MYLTACCWECLQSTKNGTNLNNVGLITNIRPNALLFWKLTFFKGWSQLHRAVKILEQHQLLIYRVNGDKMVIYRLLFLAEISYFFVKTWPCFQENLIQFWYLSLLFQKCNGKLRKIIFHLCYIEKINQNPFIFIIIIA